MPFKGTLIISGMNAKTTKGDGTKYETAIMYMAPHKNSGVGNVCPMAEIAGCTMACLYKAGRGAMSNVQKARINKAKRYFADRKQFMDDLVTDLEKFVRYCERKGIKPAVRLNGTSDIQFETAHPCHRIIGPEYVRFGTIFDAFPEVQFYDYTKVYKRVYKDLPSNYSLVLSYSGADPRYQDAVNQAYRDTGCNMAIVYRTKERRDFEIEVTSTHPEYGNMWRVIDGDETDLRFTDPKGVIVGLYAKGPAKHDDTGFVVG